MVWRSSAPFPPHEPKGCQHPCEVPAWRAVNRLLTARLQLTGRILWASSARKIPCHTDILSGRAEKAETLLISTSHTEKAQVNSSQKNASFQSHPGCHVWSDQGPDEKNGKFHGKGEEAMRVTDPALAGPKGNPLALHVSAGHLNLCLYPWGSYRTAEPESASVPPSPLPSPEFS